MYPILILRSEFVCLVILIFLFFTSRFYNVSKESASFRRTLFFSIIHIIFDAVTVITVNHSVTAGGSIPGWVNWLSHVIFYLSAIFFSNELVNYVVTTIRPNKARTVYGIGHTLIAIYICCLPFLEIGYFKADGTWSSMGMAANVGYSLAFLFFITALVACLINWKTIPTSIKAAFVPMLLVLMVTEVGQIIWRELLFTGGAITIVTVGIFFSLENPVEVFKKKAMVDALTGVQSRSSFEEEIEALDVKFKENPGDEYIFVFCDLNDLRSVNNRLGHAEGDNYITLIASAIRQCMKKASAVYRIGGDEFLVYYNKVDEAQVEKEIKNLQNTCIKQSKGLDYVPSVSVGYAKSSPSHDSLRDVVKTADYVMYQNKSKKNSGKEDKNPVGAKLNYAGLTDMMFEALCASNDKNYPFITNLDTNVTRISPRWKEYFGLDEEFYFDFISSWKDRIHPDYFDGYMEDVLAVLNGHRKYHNFDYYAKKADGEYVRVSCHGSVFRNNVDGSTYFTGFIINYGMEDNIDKASGLKNYEVLTANASKYLDEKKPFIVLKLKINSFARINMLYGYKVGNEVIKKIVDILVCEAGKDGKVYCQGAVNFTIFFDTTDEKLVEEYYKRVSEILYSGIITENVTLPINISGGAVNYNGENINIDRIRGGLVFALEESHYYQRNEIVFYHDIKNQENNADIVLLSKIHADALAERINFKLRYQPIVDVKTKKTIGAEALLRWIHPDYGEIKPKKFIGFLENDSCYYGLGLAIIDSAVRDAKKFREKIEGFRINVNITALQLQNESFAENVFEILKKYDYAPNGLILELTERCKEMDSEFLKKKIEELRRRGIQVAFDDMGTGYSTLNLLMDIPVDEIKLDKEFVRDIGTHENYELFVRALVQGSSSYGNNYTICFEGIENEEDYNTVSKFGNFLAQGYYFAKPLLIEEFKEHISKEN